MKANRRIKNITRVLLILMSGAFALTAGLVEAWEFVITSLAFGLMWYVLLSVDLHFGDTLLFLLYALFCALGVLEGLPLTVMAAVLCLDLAVWNLSEFIGTLLGYSDIINQRKLENLRLRRLGLTLGAAYLLTLIPMLIEIQLGFTVTLAVALLAFFLLGQALLSLRRKEKKKD